MAMKPESGLPPQHEDGVSRRTFLKGAGAVAAVGVAHIPATAVAHVGKDADADVLGPGPVSIRLSVNQTELEVKAPPSTTLLDLLRDHHGLTGAKRVCDRGSCGACTVLLDGRVVDSCSMLAIDAVGREITTVEGIGTPENLSDLQQAFVEKDALQCGFCTPGMVVSCTALLAENPKPSRDQIRQGIAGNICRCGTYQNIIEAVEHTFRKGGK
ncbi:MAG: (2Fe-2S)-binding protein [Planctomycetota bacterium]|nr:(2Fe-2S)-binding protein [Planctomycetota bacterium]